MSLGLIKECVNQSDPLGLNVRDKQEVFFISLYIRAIFHRLNLKKDQVTKNISLLRHLRIANYLQKYIFFKEAFNGITQSVT